MIKLTNLSKALQGAEYLAWFKKNNFDYITNGHFMIITKKEIKGSALTKLVKELGGIPHKRQGIHLRNKHINDMTDKEIDNMIDIFEKNLDNVSEIKYTYLTENSLDMYKKEIELDIFINKQDDYIYLNKQYTQLIDKLGYNDDVTIYGDGSVMPVYFQDGVDNVMILPVRQGEDNEYLKGGFNLG